MEKTFDGCQVSELNKYRHKGVSGIVLKLVYYVYLSTMYFRDGENCVFLSDIRNLKSLFQNLRRLISKKGFR